MTSSSVLTEDAPQEAPLVPAREHLGTQGGGLGGLLMSLGGQHGAFGGFAPLKPHVAAPRDISSPPRPPP